MYSFMLKVDGETTSCYQRWFNLQNQHIIQRLQNDLNSPMLKVRRLNVKQRHDFNVWNNVMISTVKQRHDFRWNNVMISTVKQRHDFASETTSQYQRWSNLQNRNIIQRWFNHGTRRWFTVNQLGMVDRS